jgi:threonine synthase
MQYIDTRGRAPRLNSDQVLLAGTAPGGGLYVPRYYPNIEMGLARSMTYPSLATHALFPYFEGSISLEDLDAINQSLYTSANFGHDLVTPVLRLDDGLGLLRLSGGQTLAFKDLAMKWVAPIIAHVSKRMDRRVIIVVSTSGDTGGAAVEAFRGLKGVELVVLYPKGRVSQMQQRMMTTAQDANVHALEVEGVFDDCQAIVKGLFDDVAFANNTGLSVVNSINWGRIAAQVVYWASCGAQMLNRGVREFDVVVPSGNFGNAYSAHVARQSGVPIRTIVVATNQNDVLDRTFKTGIYKKAERVYPSSSPSMDIQVSSNFERLLFDASERDGTTVAALYDGFLTRGEFDAGFLLEKLMGRQGWASGSAGETEVEAAIRWCYETHHRIVDPHTAVGLHVARQYRHDDVPIIVAETASPYKFPDAIEKAIGVKLETPDAWKHLAGLKERIWPVAADVEEVKEYITKHVR